MCSLFYSSYGNNTFVAVASTGTGNDNLLTWQTASEVNNSHFNIERSTNGSTFHSIGQVKGNNKPSCYQYVDENPLWEAGGFTTASNRWILTARRRTPKSSAYRRKTRAKA
jgi:hypothetical protein